MSLSLKLNEGSKFDFKVLKFSLFLVYFLFAKSVFANNQVVLELIATQLAVQINKIQESSLQTEVTSGFEKYVPVKSMQYSVNSVHHSETAKSTEGVTQNYSLRFDLKSYKEITQFSESKKLTNSTLKLTEIENRNLQNYLIYQKFCSQILNLRLLKIFGARKIEIENMIKQKSDLMGLSKVKIKDLLDDLVLMQKLESEIIDSAQKPQNGELIVNLDSFQIELAARYLADVVTELNAQLRSFVKGKDGLSLSLMRKQNEVNLDRVNKEISWADDEKIFDHFEFQRDSFKNEDAFKITINLPWLRFDNDNRNRERVLLKVKEETIARERTLYEHELQLRLNQLESQIQHIVNSKPKFEKLKSLERQFKDIKDIAMLSSLAQLKFELEKELLDNTALFYEMYFGLLKDFGGFAELAGQNLFDPQWNKL